jgi:hypothetical protein
MADRVKPLGLRSGGGARPRAILVALFLTFVLLLLFRLVSHAHW